MRSAMQAAVPAPKNFTVAVGGTSVALNPTMMLIACYLPRDEELEKGEISAPRRDRGTLLGLSKETETPLATKISRPHLTTPTFSHSTVPGRKNENNSLLKKCTRDQRVQQIELALYEINPS